MCDLCPGGYDTDLKTGQTKCTQCDKGTCTIVSSDLKTNIMIL